MTGGVAVTVGTAVTNTEANFGSTRGSGTVTFNGTVATTITSWGSYIDCEGGANRSDHGQRSSECKWRSKQRR
jgi:hypothetical protein